MNANKLKLKLKLKLILTQIIRPHGDLAGRPQTVPAGIVL